MRADGDTPNDGVLEEQKGQQPERELLAVEPLDWLLNSEDAQVYAYVTGSHGQVNLCMVANGSNDVNEEVK